MGRTTCRVRGYCHLRANMQYGAPIDLVTPEQYEDAASQIRDRRVEVRREHQDPIGRCIDAGTDERGLWVEMHLQEYPKESALSLSHSYQERTSVLESPLQATKIDASKNDLSDAAVCKDSSWVRPSVQTDSVEEINRRWKITINEVSLVQRPGRAGCNIEDIQIVDMERGLVNANMDGLMKGSGNGYKLIPRSGLVTRAFSSEKVMMNFDTEQPPESNGGNPLISEPQQAQISSPGVSQVVTQASPLQQGKDQDNESLLPPEEEPMEPSPPVHTLNEHVEQREHVPADKEHDPDGKGAVESEGAVPPTNVANADRQLQMQNTMDLAIRKLEEQTRHIEKLQQKLSANEKNALDDTLQQLQAVLGVDANLGKVSVVDGKAHITLDKQAAMQYTQAAHSKKINTQQMQAAQAANANSPHSAVTVAASRKRSPEQAGEFRGNKTQKQDPNWDTHPAFAQLDPSQKSMIQAYAQKCRAGTLSIDECNQRIGAVFMDPGRRASGTVCANEAGYAYTAPQGQVQFCASMGYGMRFQNPQLFDKLATIVNKHSSRQLHAGRCSTRFY